MSRHTTRVGVRDKFQTRAGTGSLVTRDYVHSGDARRTAYQSYAVDRCSTSLRMVCDRG